MVRLFYGNEPYVLQYEKKKVEQSCKETGRYPMEFEEWGEAAQLAASQVSFSGEKNMVFLMPKKLGADEKLLKFLNSAADTCDMCIFAESVDRKTKVYKVLEKHHEIKKCDKLSATALKKWAVQQLKSKEFSITEDAYDLLIRRMNYLENPSCNLYTLQNILYQMGYAERTITKEVVADNVPETCEEKVFVLSSLLLKGDGERLFFVARHLLEDREEPIAMLSAILRTYRLAFKASLYPEKSSKDCTALIGVPAFQYSDACDIPSEKLLKSMEVIQTAVGNIKNGYPKEDVFYTTLGKLLILAVEK